MASLEAWQIKKDNGADGDMLEWMSRFSTEAACERALMEARHPGGWVCPACGNTTWSTVGSRRHTVQCSRCRRQESLTSGTAMQNSRLPLTKWFLAIWLVSHSKRGISALELARDLGVSEVTGRRVLLRLRGAMSASECLRQAAVR